MKRAAIGRSSAFAFAKIFLPQHFSTARLLFLEYAESGGIACLGVLYFALSTIPWHLVMAHAVCKLTTCPHVLKPV